MATKLHIKKGDTVVVIAGESKGQRGKVLSVQVEKQRAVVEGINMVYQNYARSIKKLLFLL